MLQTTVAALQDRFDDVDLFEHLSIGRDMKESIFAVTFGQARARDVFLPVDGRRSE
jgi:hypothetical protein